MSNHRNFRVQDASDVGGSFASGKAPIWDGSRFVMTTTSRKQAALNAWGILDESYDYGQANTNQVLTSGRIYQVSLGLLKGDVVTNILVSVPVAAVGAAPTLIRLGLADSTTTMLAVTANVASSANWLTANVIYAFALSAPYTVLADGLYQLVILQNGSFATTQPQVGARSQAQPLTSQISSGPRRFGHSSTNGNTDLPAVASALPTMTTGVVSMPWLAVN